MLPALRRRSSKMGQAFLEKLDKISPGTTGM
jgi:hypothetical protein